MKNLPFENLKHRLLWKILLHLLEIFIFPIIPLSVICDTFKLFDKKTVSKFSIIFIIISITFLVYLVNFFIGKIKTLPETSDKRRRVKYTLCGMIDSIIWLGVLFSVVIGYRAINIVITEAEATANLAYVLFDKLLFIFLIITICKLATVWLNALLIKYLDVADEDAERGYLLQKAYKYGGKGGEK